MSFFEFIQFIASRSSKDSGLVSNQDFNFLMQQLIINLLLKFRELIFCYFWELFGA